MRIVSASAWKLDHSPVSNYVYRMIRPVLTAILVLLGSATPAAEPREHVNIRLPLVVSDSPVPAQSEEVTAGTLFGAQLASYRSVAVIASELKTPGGAVVFPAGSVLIEHAVQGTAFDGAVYCRPRLIEKTRALFCLADRNSDGAFEQLWLGTAVVPRTDLDFPFLPQPYARRMQTSLTPIRYNVRAPGPEEAVRIGFQLSGSNPLLGEHHVYVAVGVPSASIPLIRTHRAMRLSERPSAFEVEQGTIQASKLGKGRYAMRVIKPLPAGERQLIGEYPTQTRMMIVPR